MYGDMMDYLTAYLAGVIFICGLCIGSFLNVVIWRLPRGESAAAGRSRCTACGHTLAWYDLFPLFSFFCLGGCCRYCRAPISRRYPLVEFLTGVVFVLVFLQTGLTWFLAKYLFLCAILIAVAFIDLDTQLIPDSLIITGLVGGVLLDLLAGSPGWKSALIGALVSGGFLLAAACFSDLLLKKEGMGGGDIKLALLTGLFLGWPWGPLGLLLGIFACGLLLIPLLLFKKVRAEQAIPFGPFIALGTIISLLWGEGILAWYLQLCL
jgi:leader peptidase (prepilin peptidase)/N-methyltransferase